MKNFPIVKAARMFPIFIGLLTLGVSSPARAEETGMSLNREIVAVPAPGQVTIDGDTGDWDLSAGVWSYNNPTIVGKYSVWTHMMWDEKGVYFLSRFADLTPLQNPTMGKDFSKSWRTSPRSRRNCRQRGSRRLPITRLTARSPSPTRCPKRRANVM